MSTQTKQALPTGTWNVDTVHSTVGFAVPYMAGAFQGTFSDFDARLSDGVLRGTAEVGSVQVKDPNLAAHLQSPEFFDAERFPEVGFSGTAVETAGPDVAFEGEITIKGITQPATLEGTVTGPVTDPYGNERYGLSLRTVVDRTAFGLNWNAPLPGGGFALANDVTLKAELSLVKAA